jgi:DNA-binding response OmpR family regulator
MKKPSRSGHSVATPAPPGPLCVRGRVLVAEASPDRREAVGRVFASEGFSVITCICGSEVIPLAKQHLPDVVFLDIGLKRADAGECVRVLERFEGTRSVVVVLMCPREIESNRLARLEATGALLVMVKPLTRDGLLQAFHQALAESHERKTRYEAPAQRKVAATRHVESNNSLLVRELFCPFHETPVAVDRYMLRTGKIQTDSSFFDLPVYKSAVKGADYIDYHLLGVAVCPRCLFASNNPQYFTDPENAKHDPIDHNATTRAAIPAATGERLKLAGTLEPDFFTENRTLAGAIKSYELAVNCGKTLVNANRYALSLELLRLGNYHLRLAYLHGLAGAGIGVKSAQFKEARDWLSQAFTVLSGAELFKATYQLVALAIASGDDKAAYQYITRLNEIERDPATTKDDRAALDRYLSRCRRAWEDREEHRFPWANSAADNTGMAEAA